MKKHEYNIKIKKDYLYKIKWSNGECLSICLKVEDEKCVLFEDIEAYDDETGFNWELEVLERNEDPGDIRIKELGHKSEYPEYFI